MNPIIALELHIRRSVAAGRASADTAAGYLSDARAFLRWCAGRRMRPERAELADLELYRANLSASGYKPASIARKLAAVRALCAALGRPEAAAGLETPHQVEDPADMPTLDEQQIGRLLAGAAGRDRCILALAALHGLRTVELARACVEDLRRLASAELALLVHGKGGRQRLLPLRPDVAAELGVYLQSRPLVLADDQGTPLLASGSSRSRDARLSRRGIRKIVDAHLERIGAKAPGLSVHALRHSCGTAAYRATRDIRAVQDLLGHASPRQTARYARASAPSAAAAIPVTF
jgi:site-specific recombinase XerD